MALPPVIGRFFERFQTKNPNDEAAPADPNVRPTVDGRVVSRDGGFVPGYYDNWLKGNPDKVLTEEGRGLELYDDLLDDDSCMSALQQRRLAILSKDWEVAPGDDDDPRSVKAADDFRAMLKAMSFDRATGHLHYGVWYGYAVGECIWIMKEHDGRMIAWLDDIVVPDRRWFGFTMQGELRQSTGWEGFEGEVLPVNKFFAIRTGGTHDFAFYGMGLAHWAYWPIFFKRSAIKFWALFLERLGRPTVAVEFKPNESQAQKDSRMEAAVAIFRDSAVVVPEGTLSNKMLEVIEAQRSAAGASGYDEFVKTNDDSLFRIILGTAGTAKATPGGLGGDGQASKDEGVKAEIVKADADLICEGINETAARWVTNWNYGPDVAPPRVYRVLDDVEDLDQIADRDVKLNGIGIKRTDESIKEIYGESYERVEGPSELELIQAKAGLLKNTPPTANDNGKKPNDRAANFDAHAPAPLYVRRDVLNAAEIKRHYAKQGITTFVPDMHVTILYSKSPVDWFDMGSMGWNEDDLGRIVVKAGGPRKMDVLGDDKAVALIFDSLDLKYRHESMIERGASSDYESYLAHVTITYDPGEIAPDALDPWTGPIKLGPEIFEEIKERGFDPSMIGFAASELEAIDRFVAAAAEDANPLFEAMAEHIRDNLQGVKTVEGARVALLQAMETMPVKKLAEVTGLALLAERADAFVGAEDDIEA